MKSAPASLQWMWTWPAESVERRPARGGKRVSVLERESLRRVIRDWESSSGGCESKTPFWMYWHESMGKSETESLRVLIGADLWSG